MSDPFSNPAAGGAFNAKDHVGRLLLITPTDYKEGVKTVHGEKDVVVADIVVIDEKAPADSEKIEGGYIFGGVLIGQTKPFVGKGLVLGRLRQGTAKPGQNPPWELADPTEEEKVAARGFLASTAPSI